MDGADLVFHLAAIRITHCAEDPRLAHGGARQRHVQRGRGRACRPACSKVVASSTARSTAWPSEFPTTEAHHPYNNRTLYGALKVFNEGLLRSFNDMFGLPYVGLRYFNVYGPRMDVYRRVHRGADPLDGADHRRRAAAHLRRRQADDGLHLRRPTSPGPTSSPRRPTSTTRSSTSPAAPRRASTTSPPRSSEVMGSDLRAGVRPRARRQPGAAPPGRHVGTARDLLGFEAQVDLEQRLARPGRVVATSRRPTRPQRAAS